MGTLCLVPDANEKLLPLVINSMSMWDVNMQTECSQTFQNEALIDALSTMNKEMLLMQVLEILGSIDFVLYERVSLASFWPRFRYIPGLTVVSLRR